MSKLVKNSVTYFMDFIVEMCQNITVAAIHAVGARQYPGANHSLHESLWDEQHLHKYARHFNLLQKIVHSEIWVVLLRRRVS